MSHILMQTLKALFASYRADFNCNNVCALNELLFYAHFMLAISEVSAAGHPKLFGKSWQTYLAMHFIAIQIHCSALSIFCPVLGLLPEVVSNTVCTQLP